MEERNIIGFKDNTLDLSPEEAENKAIEYISYLEENNIPLSNYKYLNYYASFNALLDENGRLKQEYKLTEASNGQSKKAKITKHIVDCINLVDKSGLNAKKYKDLFDSMSEKEFKEWMDDFCNDPDKNFYLELLPNKSEPSIYDIEKLLEKLKIPKEEYVYYRDNGFKDDPIRSRERCSVGYVTVRRLQQILSKKNTYSLDIDSRNAKTGQVSGHDKIARISDAELYALSILNADATIKEFYTARADNMAAKMDMYGKIGKYGYVYLDELNYDKRKNQTLNTIDTYLKGAGIESDLIDKDSEKAKKELQKQVLDQELNKMGLVKEDTEILNENKKTNDYYIVSDKNLDGKTLSPRIPNNFMTKNGFEENKTPRVCASTSIDGCLKGLSRNLKGEVLYIHTIDPSIAEKPYRPSIKEVPDSRITNEVWFKKPVKLKCTGKIKITEDDGKEGEKYTYGNGLVAELYGWNYEWLKEQKLPNNREYVYLAVDDIEVSRGYVDYPLTEQANGKYVNLTLEGLETFLEKNNLSDEYSKYIKVPIDKVEIMLFDEPTEGAIIKLPFAYDIENYKDLK